MPGSWSDFLKLRSGPAPPPSSEAGAVRVYADADGALRSVQSDGTDAAIGEGGGSTPGIPLEDPGNVYELDTAVIDGYQIAETIQGELRVFEVTTPGTTDSGSFSAHTVHLEPLGETQTGSAVWRYLGIVGQVSWENAPLLLGVTVDEDGFHVASSEPTSEAATFFQLLPAIGDPGNVWQAATPVSSDRIAVTVGGASRVFEASGAGTTGLTEPTWLYDTIGQTTTDGTASWSYRGIVGGPETTRPVFVANTAGDADWYLDQNNGSGFRFNQSLDGVLADAGVTEMNIDGFRVARSGSERFEVQYSPFRVTIRGLPIDDPLVPGQLWNDAGTLKVSAGPP